MEGLQTNILTATLDGKHIAYSPETEFLVQVGKGIKGNYKTRYSIRGNLAQAYLYFDSINIGLGYKKRLLMPTNPKPLLAREFYC